MKIENYNDSHYTNSEPLVMTYEFVTFDLLMNPHNIEKIIKKIN